MSLFLISLVASLALAFILWLSIRPGLGVKTTRNRTIFLVNMAVGVLIGVPLLYSSADDVAYGIAIGSWPEAVGEVVTAAITEDIQHRPEITVRYTVNDSSLTAVCDLGVSGFGSRKYRKNTADKIITEYASGSIVTVRYNPADPSEATLRRGLRWAPLVRLTVGAFFVAAGVFFLFSALGPARAKKAE